MKSFIYIILLSSLSVQAQNGIIRSYYSNHKIQARLSYVNDVLDSKSIWYYDNGNLETIKTYNQGKLNGKVTEFYKTGLVKEDYSVSNGIRDGIDKIYWENGALKEIRYYNMGKLTKRDTIENDSLFVPKINEFKGIIANKRKLSEIDMPICDVDICPEPIGGIKAIQERVVYPKEAKQYGLEGNVSIVATINKEGFVTASEIIKGLGLGCDEAALKAVKKSRFLPGHDKGNIVKSHLTLNIEFKIEKTVLASAQTNRHSNASNEQSNIDIMTPSSTIEDSTDILLTQSTESKKNKVTSKKTNNSITENTKKQSLNDKLEPTEKQPIKAKLKLKTITCQADVCPEPEGGISALFKRFKIPHKAYQLKLNGEIVINASIDQWGNVIDTKVLKGVGYGVGTAAEVAVLFTKFKPGMKNGKPVPTTIKIVLPVKTQLKNDAIDNN